jgi:nucleoid DNA-binding protein
MTEMINEVYERGDFPLYAVEGVLSMYITILNEHMRAGDSFTIRGIGTWRGRYTKRPGQRGIGFSRIVHDYIPSQRSAQKMTNNGINKETIE